MKTRIISAIIAIIVLLGITLTNEKILGVSIFIFSIIAMNEFLTSIQKTSCKPIKSVAYISTLGILFTTFKEYIVTFKVGLTVGISFSILVYLLLLILAVIMIFNNKKYNVVDVAVTVFGMLYISFLFSFIPLTRSLENGFYYIWIIFIGAWITDTFAYFVGCSIGKHKLALEISPKKTVEGSIGGIIGTLIIMLLYGQFLNNKISGINIESIHFFILGLITSIISQVGDLCASAIKRYVNIKDYGNIMPGHGGLLDRFDSILFIAPAVYFYLNFIL